MTRRVFKIIFFQQRCFQTTMFRFGPERGLVVHLDVGIHVANLEVSDQVHVTKLFISNSNQRDGSCLPPRGVTCVKYLKSESEQIFTIVILQFKTSVRLPLTSSVKELEEIYTFGIKNWLNVNLDKSRSTTTKNIGVSKPAMRIPTSTTQTRRRGSGLCTGFGRDENFRSHDLESKEKKAVLNSVWLKESH